MYDVDEMITMLEGFAAQLEGATELEQATREFAVSNPLVFREIVEVMREMKIRIELLQDEIQYGEDD